jgi:hypothetical protein
MTYVKTDGEIVVQFPFTVGQLKAENPYVGFPRELPADVLAQYNVFAVSFEAAPVIDDRTQSRNPSAEPTRAVDGSWALGWVVTDKSPEEIAFYDDAKSKSIRLQRNRLLSETDWIVIMHTELGTNIPAVWELYRQALRDITSQGGFPYTVEWPTKPGE